MAHTLHSQDISHKMAHRFIDRNLSNIPQKVDDPNNNASNNASTKNQEHSTNIAHSKLKLIAATTIVRTFDNSRISVDPPSGL